MEDRAAHTVRIRALNDQARTKPTNDQCVRWIVTLGVQALGVDGMVQAIRAVQRFDAFDGDNDPRGEHDFGAFEVAGDRLFWKIDYYNRSLSGGSPDPADASVTLRVLTILLASEY